MVCLERLTFRHQPAYQKKEKKKNKKNANPYKNTSHLSTKQNPKTQTVFLDQNSDSNLQFFATPPYTHRSD